jgi:AcrR family transcriptional regulator
VGRPTGPPGQARQRVLDAALDLFSEHGISGTSLQMIADRIGVTKAAVYHQFPAKEDIALGLLGDVFASLEGVISAAEERPAAERHEAVIAGVVEMMVSQRQVMSALYRDPEMERLVADNKQLSATRDRLSEVLNPPWLADGQRRRLGWAVMGAGFTRAIIDPHFAHIPDEELKAELIRLAHQILR